MAAKHDVIIIGSGAGGGGVAYQLAMAGKQVLLIEQGPFLPRDASTLSVRQVFVDGVFKNRTVWRDGQGSEFVPGEFYNVGGKTKWYGAVLLRSSKLNFDILRIVNAPELDHDQFQEWIYRSHPYYQVIVIDAGPVQGSTSERVRELSRYTLLVIDVTKTTVPMLARLRRSLDATRLHVDGVILNRRRFYIPRLFYRLAQ